jgi:hypothetical protein
VRSVFNRRYEAGLRIKNARTIFVKESDESGRLVKFRPLGHSVQIGEQGTDISVEKEAGHHGGF